MSPVVIVMFLVTGVLFCIKMPIAFAMGIGSIFYNFLNGDNLSFVPQFMVAQLNSFILLSIPFFILIGELMNRGQTSKRLFNFAEELVGQVRGGLAQVNIFTSIILAGMSGSALSDAALTTRVFVPYMEQKGYPRAYAAAITAASATIGPIIPPSVIMILIGAVNGLSVGRLFVAGFLPGLLMGLMLGIIVYINPRVKIDVPKKLTIRKLILTFRTAGFALPLPFLILGSMIFGITTPTEAAIIGVLYVFFIEAIVYKELNWQKTKDAFLATVDVASQVLFLVCLAGVFGWIVTSVNLADKALWLMTGLISKPWQALIMINLFVLFAGMFLNSSTLILILSPILYPIVSHFGIDPYHFSIVFSLNLMIGMLTPPVGLLTYTVVNICDINLGVYMKELFPFLIALLVSLIIVTFVPWISLWLPNILF